jgi:hypothetical protein
MIACCGLVCEECEIYNAKCDPVLARKISSCIREKNPSITADDICCNGCKGSLIEHWSAECPVLHCCYYEKSLQTCGECHIFPCDMILAKSKKSKRFAEAFERLKARN